MAHPLEKVSYDAMRFWLDEVDYDPSPEAITVHEALLTPSFDSVGNPQPRLVVLAGGEQSGKSWTGAHHMFGYFMWGKTYWIVAERYEDSINEFKYLTEAAIKAGVMDPENVPVIGSAPRPLRAIFNNGAEVRTLSSGDATTLAGQSPDGILMVEAGRQSYQAFRTLWIRAHHTVGWLLVSGTFESYKGRWFPDLWRTCQGDNEYGGKSFSLPSYANKKLHPLGADDPTITAMRKTLSEEEFAERILGVPRPSIGVVFPEFRRSTHVKSKADYDPNYPIRLWVDPGFYPSSYSVLWVQIINDQIRIFDEVYVNYLTNEDVASIVTQNPLFNKVERIVIDIAAEAHAGAQEPATATWRKMMAGRQVPIVNKYVKVAHGIQRTHDKLRINPLTSEPWMVFHPRCEYSISEFEDGYRFPIGKTGEMRGFLSPIDENNHSCKAAAYGIIDLYGLGEGTTVQRLPSTRRKMSYQVAN